ncbi:IS110 family transposase [Thomasclavelia cocleata]|uniref:Transposase n=1 Tax=Thomasclavelia cocleata TaxID=69824 RepID=A0A1I0G6F3_9FIRM|nr:IS110 family transposase [Thomasclavelia cocleata]MCR1961576.1 IS110 family transposase [Thomasclavelia cocleata]NDO43145.1 IS110 family transposase [Thomasclavelia cocleata]PJN81470.1 IS110 family transposase [Thomasclavelia cocleata]SET65633.1 Transposase [Thomasclavelia cocleata]
MNYLVGIDIGKNNHFFCVMDKDTGELLVDPVSFSNNKEGFDFLINKLKPFSKNSILIGMEDTGHYHFALLKFLLSNAFTVALINPKTTDFTRKMQGGITKNDKLDTLTICDVLDTPERKKQYRITKVNSFDFYEQKQLTRHHHNLKEELNVYTNRLQKCIDIVFPEFNRLFKSKYGTVYMNLLKTFGSAEDIANTDIRTIRKCFDINGRGKRIALTPEQLKECAKSSIGISSTAEIIQIKHLVNQIELINKQIAETDKKIEEFSVKNNSPILSIPGISHFSGTSILAELGDISNYKKPSQIIKFAGVAPLHYESSQFTAQHTSITKKGSKYLRKTLYQIILPVINHNPIFKQYYELKISQGKGHRCAQGHCVRKLLRIIYHLLSTNQKFDPALLR